MTHEYNECRKRAYKSKAKAVKVLKRVNHGKPFKCHRCGKWHIGHSKKDV